MKSTGNREDVDLGVDPDGWYEYCDKCGESVSIQEPPSSSGRTRPNRSPLTFS